MRIPKECNHREFGYVVLDDQSKKAWRLVNQMSYDFLTSKVYKEKVGAYWPRI